MTSTDRHLDMSSLWPYNIWQGHCIQHRKLAGLCANSKLSPLLKTNIIILKRILCETLKKWSSCSWVIDQCKQNSVLISNSRTAWATKNLNAIFWVSQTTLKKKKCWWFWDSAQKHAQFWFGVQFPPSVICFLNDIIDQFIQVRIKQH